MLRIREDQMDAFRVLSIATFYKNMQRHLSQFFPAECEELGDAGTRDVIRYGIELAAGYNLTDDLSVCHYLELMFLFGMDFDRDPRWPWAKEILANEQKLDERGVIGALMEQAFLEQQAVIQRTKVEV